MMSMYCAPKDVNNVMGLVSDQVCFCTLLFNYNSYMDVLSRIQILENWGKYSSESSTMSYLWEICDEDQKYFENISV